MRRDADWNHYAYTYGEEGKDAHVRFDVACAVMPSPDSHQQCVCVRLGSEVDFEPDLTALLEEVDCWLVGVMRYGNTVSFVLQVEDAASFEAREEALREAAPGPVSFERSAGWGFFDERVCPNAADWRRITDREQLQRLGDAVSDDPAPIVHGFYGTEKGLAAIRDRLLNEAFTVVSESSDRLEMQHEALVKDVSRFSVPLDRFARQHGSAYDGWRLA